MKVWPRHIHVTYLRKLQLHVIVWLCQLYMYMTSYARQNDVNAHVILPGAHRSARHMRRTFDTCFTLSLIYHLYVLFVWISYFYTKQNLVLKYHILQLYYNGNRIVKLWEFYRSHPSAGNKQSLHIYSFSALRMRSRPSAGHTTILSAKSQGIRTSVLFNSIQFNPREAEYFFFFFLVKE